VETIRSRIAKLTGESRDVIKNVRTIHSHCFKLLGLTKERVADKKISEFNEAHPEFAINTKKLDKQDEDVVLRNNKRSNYMERLFAQIQILRNHMTPLDKWPPDTQKFYAAWSSWMRENDYIDFTGMLEQVLERELSPNIEILFVDEAQDLTPLQYGLTRLWSESTINTTYGGDSDQCVFRWSGSVPEEFINLKHGWKSHLDQSYRVPPVIHKYGEQVIKQARNREVTTYKPDRRYTNGKVIVTMEPDLSLPGTHMIICRCNFQIPRWISFLIKNRTIWHNPYRPTDLYWNPAKTRTWLAIQAYLDLFAGKEVSEKRFKVMVDKMIAKNNIKRGFKHKILNEEFKHPIDIFDLSVLGFEEDFINNGDKKPVTEVLRLTGKTVTLIEQLLSLDKEIFLKTPKVTIGTIHSVKGGEADHVWLDTGISPIIFREIASDVLTAYDEARVAYVGVTRAKQTLGLLKSWSGWNPMLPK